MTLAGSGCDNDSDSETEGAPTDTKGARSLKKMIKSQAQQIEELQSKLEDSLVTISSQTTQINDLKRIAEIGTSAETNDVLSEYADKVSELEKEKLELVNEAKRTRKLHEEAVAAKENEIEEIKEGLQQAESSLSEMKQERDTLSEEVAGLSSAYNLLENEYRSSSSAGQSEMTAGGEKRLSAPKCSRNFVIKHGEYYLPKQNSPSTFSFGDALGGNELPVRKRGRPKKVIVNVLR